MNRKNQGSQSRGQGSQSHSQFGGRSGGQSQNSQYGQSYNQDQDGEFGMSGSRSGQGANFSGMSSFGDDTYESERSPNYRDTDYDLDGSTYGGSQDRSQRMSGRNRSSSSMGEYGNYETNDRNRQPSRFSSLDDDRSDSSSERFGSSAERFGYPSNMNPWSSNRSMGGGSRSERSSMGGGQNSWDSQDQDYSSQRMGSQYGSQSGMQPGRGTEYGSQSNSRMGSNSGIGMGSQFGSQSEMGMGTQSYGSRSQSYGEGSLGNDWGSSSSNDRGFFGKGPKGYRRSDERIKEDVCETLARNPRVDASDIEIKVEEACVTLSGTVESKEIKRAAEMAIENLSGVDDVRNELRVKKSSERGSEGSMSTSSSNSSGLSGSTYGSSAGAKDSKDSKDSSSKSSSGKGTTHI